MRSALRDFEYSENENDSDIVVVNSCTVTNGADSSVRNYINSIKRRNPGVKVILAGCGAHSRGRELFDSGAVFGVMGHSEREKIDALLQRDKAFFETGNLEHIDSTIIESFSGRSRAFVKVQEGCDFECSYCIIPLVRGRARSLDETRIAEQVQILAENGFEEFILTGTNVGSYGKDNGSSIPKLLKRLSAIEGVRRIRLGSLEPIQVDDEMIELLGEPWMAKHLHVALQHTSDEMLGIMNRRNDFAGDEKLLQRLSDAGCAIGTDFIVGHPGESNEIWAEAIERIERLPLTHIHVFTYSRRDGTASAKMTGETGGEICKARRSEIMSIIRQKNREFRLAHRHDLEVLIESEKDGRYSGLDQYYNRIYLKSDKEIKGKWIEIKEAEVRNEANYAVI